MNKLKCYQLLIIIFILLMSFTPVLAEDNLINLKVRDTNIKDVLVMLAEQSSINLVPENNLQDNITIDLNKVKIEKAIKILSKNYNYRFRKTEDNTYIVSKSPRDNLNISVINGKVTMVAKNAGMDQVLRSISHLSNANMILFGSIRKKVDIKLDNIPVKKAIKLVLSGSNYTYKKENGIYLIGEKNINSPTSSLLTSSELISLDYLKAEKIPKMLPGSIPSSIIKVIKECNAPI